MNRKLLLRARAAIDLASIIVGVLVVALVTGAISVSVFAIIPWSQNQAAAQSLQTVSIAQSGFFGGEKRYGSAAELTQAGLLTLSSDTDVRVNGAGDCWVGVKRSATGQMLWMSSTSRIPQVFTDTTPKQCVDVDVSMVVAGVMAVWASPGQIPVVNQVTNPSFEAPSPGWVEVRRNVHSNPRLDNSLVGWSKSSSVGAMTASPGGAIVDSGGPLPSGTAFMWTTVPAPAAAGEAWSGGFDVTVPAGYPAIMVRARVWGYAGVTQLTGGDGLPVTVSPGETKRVTAVLPSAPATTDGIRVFVVTNGPSVTGARIVLSNAMLEKSAKVGPYFDGATPASADFKQGWSGAAITSPSIQYGKLVEGVYGSGSTARVIESTSWAAAGTKSVRIIPAQSSVNGSYADVLNFPTPASMLGKTYTVVGTSYSDGPITGTNVRKVGLNLFGPNTLLVGGTSSNTAGAEETRATLTIPNNPAITNISVRLFNGGDPDQPDVWWDKVMLVEVPAGQQYTGPYFDGANGGYWTGVVNASKSVPRP